MDVKRSWEVSVIRLNRDEHQLDLAPLSLLSVNLIVHQCFRLWEELSQFAQMVARCVNQIQLFSVSLDLFLERRQMGTQSQEREVLILAVTHELNYSGKGD